jgi:hypothetical protein
MGAIDDCDVSYFNGVEVGHTEAFFYTRGYTIPGNLVKSGKNTIAVRVLDNGGLGGINKGPLQLTLAGDTTGQISLAGDWKYQKATLLYWCPSHKWDGNEFGCMPSIHCRWLKPTVIIKPPNGFSLNLSYYPLFSTLS